jgi:IclR family pca regulon transcriptional regulator
MSPRLPRTKVDQDQQPKAGLRDPRYSQSLKRGLAILGCFTPERPVLGIADIADELEMSRSTTHRYVITLVALGCLEQGASRKYRLGLRGTDLGRAALECTGISQHSHPLLEGLRQRTGCTVSVAVLEGASIRYVDRAGSFRSEQSKIDLGLAPGSRLPAHCTAMGKLLLAHLPDSEQISLTAEMRLDKHGPNTITSEDALLAELDKICGEGFAVNDQELAQDLYAIAAPLSNGEGTVVAAISLATHSVTSPLPRMIDASGPRLLAAADRISAGWAIAVRMSCEARGPSPRRSTLRAVASSGRRLPGACWSRF